MTITFNPDIYPKINIYPIPSNHLQSANHRTGKSSLKYSYVSNVKLEGKKVNIFICCLTI